MPRKSISAALAAALALSFAAPAFAAPPHCPPGHAKKGECSPGRSYERHDDRRYDRDHRESRRHEWRRGDRFDDSHAVVIHEYNRYGLSAPPPGHRYVRIDGEILLIAAATSVIVDILQSR